MKQKGFTLVELLVAVGIIGVLASVSLVSINSVRGKARDSKRLADMKEVQNALEAYYSSNGFYPSAVIDKTTDGLGSTNYAVLCNLAAGFGSSDACIADGAAPTYMARVNENPKPRRSAYRYVPTEAGCDNATTLCQGYKLNFELETPTGSLVKGCYMGSQDGLKKVGAGDTDAACD